MATVDVRAQLNQAIDNALDREHVRDLVEARSLAVHTLDLSQIERIRADMERYAARRLQPDHIQGFFLQAFAKFLGGTIREREPGRFRITHVPAAIRDRAQTRGSAVHCAEAPAGLSIKNLSPPRANRWPSSSAPAIPC